LFAAFIVDAGDSVSVATLKGYISAIRSTQHDKLIPWALDGNYVVARAFRAVKKRYGSASKALKIPISMSTLLLIFRRIPGWPRPEKMNHNNRLFVAASVIAVFGFLRGGEFLTSRKSGRKIL
jgi:hypothetical protein